jgi:hypothetical protein
MRLLQLLGNKALAVLLSLRVFWRPMLLLAIIAHVLLLRTRLPEDSIAADPIEVPEEEFVEITALVGDGLPTTESDTTKSDTDETVDESETNNQAEEEPPEPDPKPKPNPKPEPRAQDTPRNTPKPENSSNSSEDTSNREEGNNNNQGEEDNGGSTGGDDGGGDDGDDDDGGGDDGGATRRSEGTGILNVLKDRVYARLTAGGSGVNDPASVQAQLDSFPKVDEVDSAEDQSVLCSGKSGGDVCDPIADGTAFGALRIPQTPSSQAELIVLGGGEDTGILEGLKFSGAPIGRFGARGSGTVYHVTQDEGNVEFYLGFIKVFGGGQTFVVLWETNPLE